MPIFQLMLYSIRENPEMNKKSAFAGALVFLLFSLACESTATMVSVQDQIASAVAATQTAKAGPVIQETPPAVTVEASTSEIPSTATVEAPTSEIPPADTPLPACAPVHPGPQSLPLPAGVAAGIDEVITFKDIQDHVLGTRPVGGMTFMESDMAHLAGNLAMGADALPIVYFSLQGGGKLRVNNNNILTELAPTPNLTSIMGAEGNPFVVFVTVDMMNQSINRMYAGNLADLAGLQPVMTWTPSQEGHIGNAIHPLAVRYSGGAANGIWFTYTMEGIGNVNFPPYNGLYYLDLSTNQTVEFLGTANALGGISPDQTTIAYGAGQGGTPGRLEGGLTVRNLVSCQETYIPFNPSSNLGGGWMVFSPDNQLVSWIEASGPSNMEAAFRIRIARTDGTSMFDAPIANMTGLLGGEAPDSLRPVGWIANHLLVLEAYLNIIHRYVVIVWAPDSSQPLDPVLGAHQSIPIADGAFIGFVYP